MKRSKMFSLIEQWEQSGQTQQEFLRDKDVSKAKFSYWRQKHLKQQNEAGFTDILPETTTKTTVEVRFPSGAKVIVPRSEVGFIRTLVK